LIHQNRKGRNVKVLLCLILNIGSRSNGPENDRFVPGNPAPDA
jgi:hypothetical protein